MIRPLELAIGLRHLRAKQRIRFISFISFISALGIALGVAALITVLSVMNGFERELRSRILGMASHATIAGFRGPLEDWQGAADRALDNPSVLAAAPYVEGQAMLTSGGAVRGVLVAGDFDKKARSAARVVPGLSLRSYRMNLEFQDVDSAGRRED